MEENDVGRIPESGFELRAAERGDSWLRNLKYDLHRGKANQNGMGQDKSDRSMFCKAETKNRAGADQILKRIGLSMSMTVWEEMTKVGKNRLS